MEKRINYKNIERILDERLEIRDNSKGISDIIYYDAFSKGISLSGLTIKFENGKHKVYRK